MNTHVYPTLLSRFLDSLGTRWVEPGRGDTMFRLGAAFKDPHPMVTGLTCLALTGRSLSAYDLARYEILKQEYKRKES